MRKAKGLPSPGVLLLGPLWRETRLQSSLFWRHPLTAVAVAALPVILLPLIVAIYPEVSVPTQIDAEAINRRAIVGPNGSPLVIPPVAGVDLEWYLVPTLAAFGIATACYANLGLRLSLTREQGVLQRMRISPVRPSVYLGGWVGASAVIGLAVGIVTILTGWLLYGVTPGAGRVPLLVLAVLLGSACFCALGLATAGLVPSAHSAPACVLAVLFPLAVVSNVFYLPGQAPLWLATLGELLPLEPLRASLADAYISVPRAFGSVLRDLAVVVAWTVIGTAVAVRSFSWMPRRGRVLRRRA